MKNTRKLLIILLAIILAIILWHAADASIGVLPLALLYLAWSVGRNYARKIGEFLRQYADSGDASSKLFELPEQEARQLLHILCETTGSSLQKSRRDFELSFTAQSGAFWGFGGSAALLLHAVPRDADDPTLRATIHIRYKQQMAVRPWRITQIE